MPRYPVRYNVRWGSGSKSDINTLAVEKCERYKRKLHATLRKNKGLAQKNRMLVQALEAAKAQIKELEVVERRKLKIDSLILPQLKAWLDETKGCTRTALQLLMRSSKLMQDLLDPEVNVTLAAETSLPNDTTTPEPRPSLHPPGSQHCDQDRSLSKVLEEDEEEEDRTEIIGESLPDFTEPLEAEPEVGRSSRVLDEGASSLVTEITGQAKNIVRAETLVMPPPDKLRGHSAYEYSAAFSHRPKIPRTPCKADKEEGSLPAPEDTCASPKQRQPQPCRVSEIPLLPWPRKPEADPAAKEFGTDATNTSPLSSTTSVLDEAFMEPCSFTDLPKKVVPSPERACDRWGDENNPPEAKVRRSRSVAKSQPSDSTKRKASRATFVVKKGRSQMPEDGGSAGPVDDDPGANGQRKPGCGDSPLGLEGTTLQCPAAPDAAGPSAPRRSRASLPAAQQCKTTDKSRVKKSRAKKIAHTEEPALQPAAPVCEQPTAEQLGGGSKSRGKEAADIEAPAPEPIEKQVAHTKPRRRKLPCKRTAEDAVEEPAAQPSALAAKPDAATLEPAKKQPKAAKSRVKKAQGKQTADTWDETAPEHAAPVSLPPRPDHSGHTPRTEPALDAGAPSSTGNDTGPQDRPSGRPSRTAATKCTSYTLPKLNKKIRRP
ncbi:uncharacterized protein LOC144145977 isoform X2 [Haemaphysalis longicornis]